MTVETATQIGVDLIAPAVTIFTIGYAFQPWYASHIGRAIMAHVIGSLLLFDIAVMTQNGWLPEHYPGYQWVTLTVVVLWVIGWWYMVFALVMTRRETHKAQQKGGVSHER